MPLMKCSKNGKSGWKWGDSGTCYVGPNGRKKALQQGAAIEISKKKRGKAFEMNDEIKAVLPIQEQVFLNIESKHESISNSTET